MNKKLIIAAFLMLNNYALAENQSRNRYLDQNYDELMERYNALEEQYNNLVNQYNQVVQRSNQIMAGMQQEQDRILADFQDADNALTVVKAEYDRLIESLQNNTDYFQDGAELNNE